MPRVGSSPGFVSGEAILSAPCRRPETTSCSCADTQRGGGLGEVPACFVCPYPTLLCAVPLLHAHAYPFWQCTLTQTHQHLQAQTLAETHSDTDIQAHNRTDTLIDPHRGWDPDTQRQTRLCRLIPANTGPHRLTNANACPYARTDTRSHPRAYSLSDTVSEHPNVLTHLQTHTGPGTQHTETGHAPTDSS